MAPSTTAVWRAPAERDLAASISANEIEAYREAAADEEQHGDPIAALLVRGANLVRGYLRANTSVVMGPAGTIPESLIAPCMDYIAFDVVKRVPRANTDDRRRARQDATRLFEQARSGEFFVESYAQPENQGSAPASQLAASSTRRVTSATLDGL